jgi:hypothetical protein
MNKEKEDMLSHIALVIKRRKSVAELLSSELKLSVDNLFYKWIRLEVEQVGDFGNGWKYYFHGLDCTLGNEETGENTRLEFAPQGRVDGFTKSVLVDMKGSDLYYEKDNASVLFDVLFDEGYVDYVDAEFHQKVSSLDENEWRQYRGTLSDERLMDAMVSDRLVLKSGRVNGNRHSLEAESHHFG